MTLSITTLRIKCHNAECCYTESRYAECRYDKCHYAECCGADFLNNTYSLFLSFLSKGPPCLPRNSWRTEEAVWLWISIDHTGANVIKHFMAVTY
jgi:hypothetical protein